VEKRTNTRVLDATFRATQTNWMKIQDKTDDRLVLCDDQGDKALAMSLLSGALVLAAAWFAWEGLWVPAGVSLAAAPCSFLYLKLTRIRSTITLDRLKDAISLVVESRDGTETWDWRLSDLGTAQLNEHRRDNTSNGIFRPDLVLKDGKHVPMRPYFSAGSQSWNAVAAVKLFLGQKLEDTPVGWLPPEEFDRFFADEMKKFR